MGRSRKDTAGAAKEQARKRRRLLYALGAIALILVVLAPQLGTWLSTYEGVALRKDIQTVRYSSKKGAKGRRARVHRIEVGTADGEPFWVTVDPELYETVRVGDHVAKGLFAEQFRVDQAATSPALQAKYPWAVGGE